MPSTLLELGSEVHSIVSEMIPMSQMGLVAAASAPDHAILNNIIRMIYYCYCFTLMKLKGNAVFIGIGVTHRRRQGRARTGNARLKISETGSESLIILQ